jgi:hypothetical protein
MGDGMDLKDFLYIVNCIGLLLAKEKLGFEPKLSLQEGVNRNVEWYREFYKNASPEDKK